MLLKTSRRSLLQGLGASAALLAPVARSIEAQDRDGPPTNLVVFYTPNGFYRQEFRNQGSPSDFDGRVLDRELGRLVGTLEPLEPFRDRIALLKGLNNKAWGGNASHYNICRLLTQRRTADNSRENQADGPSLDQVLGTRWGVEPVVVLNSPAYRGSNNSPDHSNQRLSWVGRPGAATNVHPTFGARNLFDDLIAGRQVSGGTAEAERERRRQRRGFLFSQARDDLRRFEARLGGLERERVQRHVEALARVEARLESVAVAAPTCAVPGRPDPSGNNRQRLLAGSEAIQEMVVAAFGCGLNRVATILEQPASTGHLPIAGVTACANHHEVSHDSRGCGGEADARRAWPAIDQHYAGRLAALLERLEGANLLGRTVVLWVTEISQGHFQNDYTMVIAGGHGLGLRTGRELRYRFHGEYRGRRSADRPDNASYADALVSVQKALGVDEDHVGDPEYSDGGLQELYRG